MVKKSILLIIILTIVLISQPREAFSISPALSQSTDNQILPERILTVIPEDIKNKKSKAYDILAVLNMGTKKGPEKQVAENTDSQQKISDEKPTAEEKVSWEVFERKRRFYHPF